MKAKEAFMTEKKKVNIPKKGAGRRLADKLEELGRQKPPQDLVNKINRKEEDKKVAISSDPQTKVDL